jgi:hypothetical protein
MNRLFLWFKSIWQSFFKAPALPEATALKVVKTIVAHENGRIQRVQFELSDGAVIEPLFGFMNDREAHNLIQTWENARLRRTTYGQVLRMG